MKTFDRMFDFGEELDVYNLSVVRWTISEDSEKIKIEIKIDREYFLMYNEIYLIIKDQRKWNILVAEILFIFFHARSTCRKISNWIEINPNQDPCYFLFIIKYFFLIF